jgi:hypothetical protein
VPGTKFPPGILLRHYFNPFFFNNFPLDPTVTREWGPEAPNTALNHINNLQPKKKYRSNPSTPNSVPGTNSPPGILLRHYFNPLIFNDFPAGPTVTRER